MVGLTWSGIDHPWGSAPVLIPLILGLVGLIGFFVYEAFVPRYPVVSFINCLLLLRNSG